MIPMNRKIRNIVNSYRDDIAAYTLKSYENDMLIIEGLSRMRKPISIIYCYTTGHLSIFVNQKQVVCI